MTELLKRARSAVELAKKEGAAEISASVTCGSSTQLSQRDGLLEKATESRSMGLSLRIMVDDRFSSHSTSDLRPQALEAFVARAVEATRFLEPDPDWALPPRKACGISEGDLDIVDSKQADLTPIQRREWVAELEQLILSQAKDQPAQIRSTTAYEVDGFTESVVVFSNGFEATSEGTTLGHGATITVVDGDKLPSSVAWSSRAHLEDLPNKQEIADTAWKRVLSRIGSHAAASGRYPMLLDRKVVGKIIGILLGPMSGSAIHQGRSCLADKLGAKLAPDWFSLVDEPIIPRAAGSRLFDGDGFPARTRKLMTAGVLDTFLIGQYHARKLGVDPTSASTSNVILPEGSRTPEEIRADLEQVIFVDSFLGGSSNSTTGDFSFGIRGQLYKNGELVHPVSEMNIAGNLFEILPKIQEIANDRKAWGSLHTGSVLFDAIQFSGS